MWRKGNPLTLLVGMQTSTATMVFSSDTPNGLLIPSSCLTSKHGKVHSSPRCHLPRQIPWDDGWCSLMTLSSPRLTARNLPQGYH